MTNNSTDMINSQSCGYPEKKTVKVVSLTFKIIPTKPVGVEEDFRYYLIN
jgi:hypothetical protein